MSDKIREALEFYANGDHLLIAEPDAWDACSGEPANWLHDAAGTASVEDGSIAKTALAEQPDTVKVRDLLKRYFDALDRFDREGPVSLVVAAAKEADALEKELRALLAGGAE